jgi:hypothetical protein
MLPFCQGADWKPRKSPKGPGTCGACGRALQGRAIWFCKATRGDEDSCRLRYLRNHDWGYARTEALRRAHHQCRRDATHKGKLEVNHVTPREGRGYGLGCHHHQEAGPDGGGLEVLCHDCHLAETTRQIRDRHGLSPTKLRRLQSKFDRWTAWARQ